MNNLLSGEGIRIFKNFGYLSAIQVFNLIFPLIIYPYVIRVVGKEAYGIVLFAQSIAIYFSLLVNFGFNIYGTNEISSNKESKEYVARIIGAIFSIQLGLYLVSVGFLYVLSLFAVKQNLLAPLLFASYLCLNEILIPVWYFQGIEKMQYIAFCSFVSKLVSLVLIFVFVNGPNDYLNILMAYFIGALFCGILSFYKIFILDKNTFKIPNISRLVNTVKGSFPLFISHSLGGVTAKSNSFLIGKFAGKVELTYYDLAEKLINLCASFFQNFSNAIFPNVARTKNYKLARKGLRISLVFSAISIIIFYFSSDILVHILGGETMKPAVNYILILSVSLIFRAIGPIISTSILVVNDLKSVLSKSFIWVLSIYILGMVITHFSIGLSTIGIIVIFLISLLVMIAYRVFFVIKNNLTKWLI